MEPRIITTEVVDRDRGFSIFSPEELYSVQNRTGWVPNAGDLIKNPSVNGFDEVVDVDYALMTWNTVPYNQVPTYNSNPLGGVNPLKSDRYRVYVDTTKHPATMMLDNALTFNGPDVDSVRIFRGHDDTDTGEILSGYYKGGQLIDTKIPLKSITHAGSEHITKAALVGSCIAEVEHGEACTLVAYSDVGNIVCIALLHVIKTNLVMAAETPARQVTDVRLKSPFILDSNSKVLTLPVNMAIDDIPYWAEITYTDGKKELPIDQSRVSLNGLRNAGSHDSYYIASNAGQELPLVLSYRLARGESYAGSDIHEGVISKDYMATTESIDGAYSLKLFVVPVWVDSNRGYRLNYYLYNLTRGNVYDATAYVNHVAGSANFDPMLHNVKQRLNVQVDVSKVNPIYRAHIHSQSFHITLQAPGTTKGSNFLLDYVHDGETYGEQAFAEYEYTNVTFSTLDVSCGYASKAEWLKGLYYDSHPIYDRRTEDDAPEPTHFEVHAGGKAYLHPIEDWLNPIQIDFKVQPSASVVIRWIRRTPTLTQQLGLSPMLAHKK